MDDLQKTGRAHPTADAHGDDRVFGLAASALDQSVTGQARAGHAIGMADRNRSAIDVELFWIDAELVAAIDHLHRECLIQLPKADIVDRQSMPLQKPGHSMDRTYSHLVGFAACGDKAAEDAERLQALLGRELVAHDDGRAGTVRKLARLAARDGEARALRRFDRSETFRGS